MGADASFATPTAPEGEARTRHSLGDIGLGELWQDLGLKTFEGDGGSPPTGRKISGSLPSQKPETERTTTDVTEFSELQ
jgi:hypothetical protein